jgi:Protein  of unknown function (DUF3018)
MPATAAERTAKRRQTLRARGLRPVTIWVPDTRGAAAREHIRLKCREIAERERENRDLQAFFDETERDWFRMLDAEEAGQV